MKFEESNFYKALQDFFINADKKTFLQFLAEFYNRTEGIIDKDNIQDDLIKELRKLYLEFNEKGIDENIVREKVNHFLENSIKIKDINLQLYTKANNTDLATERARIDNLTKLSAGSTTGDGELIDMRVSSVGNTYTNAGESLRNQLKNAISTNVISTKQNIASVTDYSINIKLEMYKGQEIEVSLTCDDGVLNNNLTVGIGLTDVTDNNISGVLSLFPNTSGKFITPKNCKLIRVWIPKSTISKTGNVTVTVNHSKSIYEVINEIKELNSSIISEVIGEIDNNRKKNVTDCNVTTVNDNSFTIKGDFATNETVYLKCESNNKISNGDMYIGIGYTEGEQQNALFMKADKEYSFTFKKPATYIRVWISKNNVLSNGTVKFIIKNYKEELSLKEQINKLKLENFKGKTMAILGDSYSTYGKWIPLDNQTWYSDYGNVQDNNITNVKQTWWWKLSKETGLNLLYNESYSGSTICNTGYNGQDTTSFSFITRCENSFGRNQSLSPKPDILFIFGGTNDSWANVNIGSVKYSNWTDEDKKTFLPAFCYLIDYLQLWNPQARIINIINNGLKTEIVNGMKTVCEHYGVEVLQLQNISKTNNHPNIDGMEEIKNQIIKIL